MRTTTISLADGRRLTYYDRQPGEDRTAADKRELPELSTHSQQRHDMLLDEHVVVAAHRQGRTHLPSAADCPLCPSRDGRLSEIPADDYDVVVFDNRFPSLTPPGGHCEVICFSSDHEAALGSLSADRMELVLAAQADRTAELGGRPGVAQVFPFENRGVEVGVTLHHPHGQIYAFPFVPPRARRMLDAARAHHERTGGNLFAEVLAAEQDAEVRVVVHTTHWTAFVPEAARWPVELHIYPNRQVADLTELTPVERQDFAELYPQLLRKLDALYDQPLPYLAGWQQAPVALDRELGYLRLELVSPRRAPAKLKYLASVETLMGAYLNDVLPEDTARRLRELPG
ncbi:MAG: galactose-1-phosphate uridylyltransferase [Thermocrispum sp.]